MVNNSREWIVMGEYRTKCRRGIVYYSKDNTLIIDFKGSKV